MVIINLRSGAAMKDSDFDAIYPTRIKQISKYHFTPVGVAKRAAEFLVKAPGARVLDVGSGAGKFCLIGAACTQGHFTGVEHRKRLHLLAEQLAGKYKLSNLSFLWGNITEIDFSKFDAIYFFNSFFENIVPLGAIDQSVELSSSLYKSYSLHVKDQLGAMPAGARLATYFSYSMEIPAGYTMVSDHFDGKLKFWEKTC
ncbi:MAG: methyltransferase domain-containing protein [Saprospirales bacterium]|nr:methyltransferase domain-containing protein [Saprospirales bacterium]